MLEQLLPPLSGTLPPSLGNLSAMTKLSLWQNSVRGTLPHSLGTLGALVSLNLDNNHFEGGLPACLGALPRLRELGLSNNKLGGSIPASFGQLSELTVLFLDDNELIGTMPRELGGALPPPRMLCTCPAHAFGGTFYGTRCWCGCARRGCNSDGPTYLQRRSWRVPCQWTGKLRLRRSFFSRGDQACGRFSTWICSTII